MFPSRRHPRRAPSRATIPHFLRPLLLLLIVPVQLAAQPGAITGHVLSASTQAPVSGASIGLIGLPHLTFTDSAGFFRLVELPAGLHTLRVRHLAYGELTTEVEVPAGGTARLRLEVSDTAIALLPIEVEAISVQERQFRAAGTRRNVITRQQIAQALGTNLTLGDVLRQFVSGVRVRTSEGVVGAPLCIELRSIASIGNRCLSPAVFLDGTPITNPMQLYAGLPVQMIETLEIVPAAEAGARYGTGSLYGALLIETRRPGRSAANARAGALAYHDWGREGRRHPAGRTYAGAMLGNAAGLAAGVAVADVCVRREPPDRDRLTTSCTTLPTLGAALAALAAPALGGALGAMLGGRTEASRGRVIPAAIGATLALVPAYSLMLTGHRMDSDLLLGFSMATLVALPPIFATISDRRYRSIRPEERR